MTIPTPKPLTGAEQDTLWCLFRHGPTWDGEVPSKAGRSGLVERGLADRGDGWNWLTSDGTRIALEIGMGDRKEKATR